MSAWRAIKPWFNFGGMVGRVWAAMIAAGSVKVWAQVGAAMALTVLMAGFGLVIWLGPWLVEHQGLQIEWLGRGMAMSAFLTLVALVAITGLAVNFHGGRDGVTASIDQDEAQPLKVTTTTETTVTPGAPAEPGELPPDQRVQQ